MFRDLCSFGSSPGLFAASHARHLMTPRHPPRALRSLTTPIRPRQLPIPALAETNPSEILTTPPALHSTRDPRCISRRSKGPSQRSARCGLSTVRRIRLKAYVRSCEICRRDSCHAYPNALDRARRSEPNPGASNMRVLSLRDTNNRIEKERTPPTSVGEVPAVAGGRGSAEACRAPRSPARPDEPNPNRPGGRNPRINPRPDFNSRSNRSQARVAEREPSREAGVSNSNQDPEEPMSPRNPARPRYGTSIMLARRGRISKVSLERR